MKELRNNEDRVEEILKKEINNFNYKYYKIDNEIRKYIQSMHNEYTETIGPIKSEYIRIIEMKIKNNKYKGINKEEVEK